MALTLEDFSDSKTVDLLELQVLQKRGIQVKELAESLPARLKLHGPYEILLEDLFLKPP